MTDDRETPEGGPKPSTAPPSEPTARTVAKSQPPSSSPPPESEDAPDGDRLEHTLESILDDEPTHAITGKHPAPPPSFDSLPRSLASASLRRPAPPTFPPPSRGPIPPPTPPITISPAAPVARTGPAPSSSPPLSRSAPPRPGGPSSVPPPRSGPVAIGALADVPPPRGTPRIEPMTPIGDDAPTIPGQLAPPERDEEDPVDSLEPLGPSAESDALAPPRIPVFAAEPDPDPALDRKDRSGTKRRSKAPKKGRRATVRIPDDQVPVSLSSDEDDAEEAEVTSVSPPPRLRRDDDVTGLEGSLDETPTAPASLGVTSDGGGPPRGMEGPGSPRALGGGVVADEQAIFVLRPIEIVSDMPPVPPSSKPGGDADATEDLFEEIEPERMSLPGETFSDELRSEPKPPPRLPPNRAGSAPAPASNPSHLKSIPPGPEGGGRFIPAPPPMPVAPAPLETKPLGKTKRPWWSELFEDDLASTLDRPQPKATEREVDFIVRSFGFGSPSQVLDVGCGHGAHAVELAARGHQVVAVDLSSTMLAHAREHALGRGQSVKFVQGDMRQFELDGVFDGVFAWTGTFGYFDDATNLDVLVRLARALKPGGKLLLDLPNRDFIAPRSPSTAWFAKKGCVCMDEARFDFATGVLTTKRMVLFESGRAKEVEYSMRLYAVSELTVLLQGAGMKLLELSGDRATRGAYFGAESPRLIVLAEKG